MFSIFTQAPQNSVAETQQSPANEGNRGGSPAIGYSTCVVA